MEALTRDAFFEFVRAAGIRSRGKSAEEEVLNSVRDTLTAIAGNVDTFQGGQMKILGDMIAHQVALIADALAISVEIPEHDAFIRRGGAFRLQS
jgi:hypothetical protein